MMKAISGPLVLALAMVSMDGLEILSSATPAYSAPAFSSRSQNDDNIPVEGQHIVPSGSSTRETSGMIVTLHGVYRTPSGTVVYYSAARVDGSGTNAVSEASALRGTPSVNGSDYDHALLIDPGAQKGYLRLPPEDAAQGCICSSSMQALLPGGSKKALVLAMAFAPLPSDVKEIDVIIAGGLFTGVPVQDQLPAPQLGNSKAVVLGTGWPGLDQSVMKKAVDKSGSHLVVPVTFPTRDEAGVKDLPGGGEQHLAVDADVLFEFDKATLTAQAMQTISALADRLKGKGVTSGTVQVVGHTDNQGSHARNVELSKQRAEAVAAELKKRIPAEITLETAGKAESEPIASNSTEAGRAQNRRVELNLPGRKQ